MPCRRPRCGAAWTPCSRRRAFQAAASRQGYHVPRQLARHLLPVPVAVSALEEPCPNHEGVHSVWVSRTERKAVDVGAGQVVGGGLPGGAAVPARTGRGSPGTGGHQPGSRQGHGVEVSLLNDRVPCRSPVVAAHDTLVVAKETTLGSSGLKAREWKSAVCSTPGASVPE